MNMRRFALFILIAGLAAAGEFTVEDYWRLNKARLELSAIEWEERISSAQQAKGDMRAWRSQSDAITNRFSEHQRKLHANYGTNPQGYTRYATDHAREVESFLQAEENAPLKRDIERLFARIRSLMQQFDAIAAPMMQEAK